MSASHACADALAKKYERGQLRRMALANEFDSDGLLRHDLKASSQGALDERYDRLQLSAVERRNPWGCLLRS